MEQHKQLSLPDSSLAEVCLALGDLKGGVGLYADSKQLQQQALLLSQHECSCLGLPERQVSSLLHAGFAKLSQSMRDTIRYFPSSE